MLEEGYVIFEIADLTENSSNFRNRYENKNYSLFNDNTEYCINKVYKLIDDYIEYIGTGSFNEDDNEDSIKNKAFVSEETQAEIMLYKAFIKELDFFVLTRNLIYKTDKLHVFKNNEDRSSTPLKITGVAPSMITIEDILNHAIQDTDIDEVLDIKRYIYPCWRIAIEHFDNQGWNYNIVEEHDKYILVKSFL